MSPNSHFLQTLQINHPFVQTPHWFKASLTINNTLCVTVTGVLSIKDWNVWQHLYWIRFIFMHVVTDSQWHEIIKGLEIYAMVKRWVEDSSTNNLTFLCSCRLSGWNVGFKLVEDVGVWKVLFCYVRLYCNTTPFQFSLHFSMWLIFQ